MDSKFRQETVSQAVFAPFNTAWYILGATFLLCLVQIITQVAYIRIVNVNPVQHVQKQIEYYTQNSDPAGISFQLANSAYTLLVDKLKLHLLITQAQSKDNANALSPMIRQGLWIGLHTDLIVALYSVILYAAKLGVVVTALPVLLIWLLAFGIDGLVQRHIRWACWGQESATIYHRAKLYGTKLLPSFVAVVFLCTPFIVSPFLVFIPAILVSAVLIRLQATYYKKYV